MPDQPSIVIMPSVPNWIPGGPEKLQRALHDRLDGGLVDLLRTPSEARDRIATADIAITFELPPDLLADADNLAWVQAVTAGVDHYDLDAFQERGIALTNVSGIHAQPIAEHVLGFMLIFERRFHRALRQKHDGRWERFPGGELGGKTLGVVGVGAIGSRVADFGSALGMRVIGTKRDTSDVPDSVDEIYPPDDLYEVLDRADYLVLACPLTDETHHLIGEDEFKAMPASAVLVNIARGDVVVEDDLVTALQIGEIRGAGCDVFHTQPLDADSELWDLSNVVISPNMAGVTPRYWERTARIFADNYERFVDGDLDAFTNRVV